MTKAPRRLFVISYLPGRLALRCNPNGVLQRETASFVREENPPRGARGRWHLSAATPPQSSLLKKLRLETAGAAQGSPISATADLRKGGKNQQFPESKCSSCVIFSCAGVCSLPLAWEVGAIQGRRIEKPSTNAEKR